MITYFVVLLLGAAIILAKLFEKSKNKLLNNIPTIIFLIILVVIVVDIFLEDYQNTDDFVNETFTLILVITIFVFYKFSGYSSLKKQINKRHLTIICHILCTVSRIVSLVVVALFLFSSFFEEFLKEREMTIQFPIMTLLLLSFNVGNIFSYLIVKIITKINNRIRSNGT
jgi:small neutral amino acid transporter SnatA (MarC family)